MTEPQHRVRIRLLRGVAEDYSQNMVALGDSLHFENERFVYMNHLWDNERDDDFKQEHCVQCERPIHEGWWWHKPGPDGVMFCRVCIEVLPYDPSA